MIVRNARFPGPVAQCASAPPPECPAKALAADLRAACRATRMSARKMGRAVAFDPNFIVSLEQGRVPRSDTIERARRALARITGEAS